MENINTQILTPEEEQDINTFYTLFNNSIYSIYLTNAAVIPFLNDNLDDVEILIILNDIYDPESALIKEYLKTYQVEHLGTRLRFKITALNNKIQPIFHVEGDPLPADFTLYKYYFMNTIEPICGEIINFNIDLLTLVNQDYVFELFNQLAQIKRIYTLPNKELVTYTKEFYPLIFTTYILLTEDYNFYNKEYHSIIQRAYHNLLDKETYEKFKPDFLELLKKYDIDF